MPGKLVNKRTAEEFAITVSPAPMGRHEANTIVLPGFAISRFHAEIGELAPEKYYIEDMGSTYGTYVNGEKLEGRVSLHDGDEVMLGVSRGFPEGEYKLVFRQTAGEAPSQPRKKPPTRHAIKEGSVEVEARGSAHVFRLDGVFRRPECDALAERVSKALRADPKDVVLNVTRVDYMNSYALGVLMRLFQDATEEDKRLVLAGAHGLVLKLFKTVGIDRRLGCYSSEEEALEAL